jgi:hypothetical protein
MFFALRTAWEGSLHERAHSLLDAAEALRSRLPAASAQGRKTFPRWVRESLPSVGENESN